MKRFPHYLRPSHGGHCPRAIMCLDVVGGSYHRFMDTGSYEEKLRSWNAAILERANDDYTISHIASGQGNVGLWSALERAANELSPLWVFSYRSCRVWNLLGLWEEIENDRIIIAERPDANTVSEYILRGVRGPDSTTGAWPVSAGGLSRLLGNANGYMVSGDPPNILRCRFRDSQRWIMWVDIRNYGVERAESTEHGRETTLWLTRCVRSISDALRTYNLGSLRPTAGSQAMHGFRASYYKGGIYVGTGRETTALESSGYYGGRCECRVIGAAGETCYAGDYSAQYCRLYRDNVIPIRCTSYQRTAEGQSDCPVGSVSDTIARVDIETEEAAYPYRRRHVPSEALASQHDAPRPRGIAGDTDIIYPIGRFTTTLCGPELQDALDRGRIKHWHEWATYEMQPALSEYATAILRMRSEAERLGDTTTIQLAKRLGNSLPGKFGERRKDWIYSPESSCDIQYGEWYSPDKNSTLCRYRAIAGVVHRESIPEYAVDAVPAIAAWVTSLGRIQLLETIRTAGWNNVYYYDTDSIFTNSCGWKVLMAAIQHDMPHLSNLRKVGEDDDAEFVGIKHYRFGAKYVYAGQPRSIKRLPSGAYAHTRSLTPTELVRAGERPTQREVILENNMDSKYRHGVVGADGRVSPIVLQEW